MAKKTKNDNAVNTLTIYVVSGGYGASGEQLVETVLAQFPDANARIVKIPHARKVTQIESVVKKAKKDKSIIVHTMVEDKLRRLLLKTAEEKNIVTIDLIGTLVENLSNIFEIKPKGKPGLYHAHNEDYFKRIGAIEFTVSHDDGVKPNDLKSAEIVVAGVSRCGKTPLSMYLAVKGWKVANVPLVMGIAPPEELFKVEKKRVIGLIIDYEHLMSHRRKRHERIGAHGATDYINPTSVNDELKYARKLYKKIGCQVVNVTKKPIESSADEIIEIIVGHFGEKAIKYK